MEEISGLQWQKVVWRVDLRRQPCFQSSPERRTAWSSDFSWISQLQICEIRSKKKKKKMVFVLALFSCCFSYLSKLPNLTRNKQDPLCDIIATSLWKCVISRDTDWLRPLKICGNRRESGHCHWAKNAAPVTRASECELMGKRCILTAAREC